MLVVVCMTIAACSGVSHVPEQQVGLERGGWQDRYFQYSGEYQYYVGFTLHQLHADTNIDYRAKLDFLAQYGINKIRIWLYPTWFGLPGDNNYPIDGKILYPWKVDAAANRFDLDEWDPAFWARTRDLLTYAREKGFIVEITLFSIQEPREYFRKRGIAYAFHHRNNIQNFGRPTDEYGNFTHGFFDIDYTDNGLRLADYHKAYIDKALEEFEAFDHVYYELINESPGPTHWVTQDLPHNWMKFWLRYIADRTGQPVTTHSHGYMDLRNGNEDEWTSDDFVGIEQIYQDETYLDGFNFHFYSTDPNDISMALSGYQLKKRMLICNEGGLYFDIDRSQGYPRFRLTFQQEDL